MFTKLITSVVKAAITVSDTVREQGPAMAAKAVTTSVNLKTSTLEKIEAIKTEAKAAYEQGIKDARSK